MQHQHQHLVPSSTMTETVTNYFRFRVVGPFVASCLLSVLSGVMTIFFVYIVEIKAIFDYNQTQAEIHSACHMIGKRFIPLFAIIYKRLGFYGIALIGLLISESGVLLMALAARMPDTFSQLSPLLFLFQFMIANGMAFLYFLVLLKTLETFTTHSGKAVSISSTMPQIGQMFFSQVYTEYFDDVNLTSSYFYTGFAITTAAALMFILVHGTSISVADKANGSEEEGLMPREKEHTHNSVKSGGFKGYQEESPDQQGFRFLLSSGKFHLLFWSGTIVSSTNFVMYTNIRMYLETMDKNDIQARVITIMLSMVIITRLAAGVLYDALTQNHLKALIFLCCSITNILSFAVILLWPDNTATIFVSSILVGVTLGAVDAYLVPYSKEIFGLEHFAEVQSILMSSIAIFTTAFSIITGLLYDRIAGDDNICRGPDCYRLAYFILLITSLLSPFLIVGLMYNCYWEYQASRQ